MQGLIDCGSNIPNSTLLDGSSGHMKMSNSHSKRRSANSKIIKSRQIRVSLAQWYANTEIACFYSSVNLNIIQLSWRRGPGIFSRYFFKQNTAAVEDFSGNLVMWLTQISAMPQQPWNVCKIQCLHLPAVLIIISYEPKLQTKPMCFRTTIGNWAKMFASENDVPPKIIDVLNIVQLWIIWRQLVQILEYSCLIIHAHFVIIWFPQIKSVKQTHQTSSNTRTPFTMPLQGWNESSSWASMAAS